MKKTILFVLTVIASVYSAVAQTGNADTLIYAEGKIINATTKEPVTARISYQSLPYGSKVGFLSGSSFSFPLYEHEKYAVLVEANGYAPAKYMLDPASANGDRKVIQDIELGLPSSASTNAETTHTVGKVMRLDALGFQVGTWVIATASYPELDQVVKMLSDNPHMVIQLEGHTDVKGDPRKNLELSEKRVEAVRVYLLSKGVSKTKVKTKAYGGTMPLSRDNSEDAHKLNRRVEVRILQN